MMMKFFLVYIDVRCGRSIDELIVRRVGHDSLWQRPVLRGKDQKRWLQEKPLDVTREIQGDCSQRCCRQCNRVGIRIDAFPCLEQDTVCDATRGHDHIEPCRTGAGNCKARYVWIQDMNRDTDWIHVRHELTVPHICRL